MGLPSMMTPIYWPWKRLVDVVHSYDAKIFAQLAHHGRQTTSLATGHATSGSFSHPCPLAKEMPKELNKQEIEDIVESFGEAARRAKEAGCDGVEIHGAHGYLLCNSCPHGPIRGLMNTEGPLMAG